ncbi:hypothetical protein SDC9_165703 [bioreactor metagenome]|uniref:Uncharacterized protein n=1 Tax=bioreactor metagenome TaxID=1076179 RepID=A0A645G2K8_9ZZZZ
MHKVNIASGFFYMRVIYVSRQPAHEFHLAIPPGQRLDCLHQYLRRFAVLQHARFQINDVPAYLMFRGRCFFVFIVQSHLRLQEIRIVEDPLDEGKIIVIHVFLRRPGQK